MATLIDTPASRYFRPRATPVLSVRRGSYVLSVESDKLGVGRVEGTSYLPTRWCPEQPAWGHTVRWADGTVDSWDALPGLLVTVDAGTVLVEDQFNNVGRHCSVRGDAAAGEPCRVWRVVAAVNGGRYLVAHRDTDVVRVVGHRDMSNLY